VGREIRWGGLWWLVDGSGNGGDSECGLVGGCRLLAAGGEQDGGFRWLQFGHDEAKQR
jgi:hypothetical protein